MSPREMAAWLSSSRKIDRLERADKFWLATMAAQGDAKAVKKVLKRLQKDRPDGV